MKQKSIFTIFFFVLIIFSRCTDDILQNKEEKEYVLEINYTQKNLNYQDNSLISDPLHLSISDDVSSLKKEDTEVWKIQIAMDGTSRQEVIYPTQTTINGKVSSIFDDEKRTYKRVYENNMVYAYNKNGDLISSFAQNSPNMKHLIEKFKKIKTRSSGESQLKSASDFTHVVKTEDVFTNPELGQLREVSHYDTVANALVKSELYNAQNELIHEETFLYYMYAKDVMFPREENSKMYFKNAYNETYSNHLIHSYSNYSIINNLYK